MLISHSLMSLFIILFSVYRRMHPTICEALIKEMKVRPLSVFQGGLSKGKDYEFVSVIGRDKG